MWNTPTYGEWDVDHRNIGASHEIGQGSLVQFPAVPDNERRRQELASSYRASLHSSKPTARARLSKVLGTTLCTVRLWYARRSGQELVTASPC